MNKGLISSVIFKALLVAPQAGLSLKKGRKITHDSKFSQGKQYKEGNERKNEFIQVEY